MAVSIVFNDLDAGTGSDRGNNEDGTMMLFVRLECNSSGTTRYI
jgi:hypothetical protein